MRFDAAWYWLLLPLVLFYVVWLSGRSYAHLVPRARWASVATRGAIMVCLIGALSRPSWLADTDRHHVVFLLDVSQSISSDNLQAALDDIDRLARSSQGEEGGIRTSLVAFGQNAQLLLRQQAEWDGFSPEVRRLLCYRTSLPEMYAEQTQLISSGASRSDGKLRQVEERIEKAEAFRDDVAGDHTDFERALRLAANCGETGESRTIYLFTDGQFDRGRWDRVLHSVGSAGSALHVVALNKPVPPEVAVAEIMVPQSVRVNQGFTAEVRVAANVETNARLSVIKDGYTVREIDVAVKAATNTISIPGLYFTEKGFHSIEVAVRPEADTQPRNNRARSLMIVPGEARVLYVEGDENQIPYLKSALELEGMSVEARPASGVPLDLSELLSFDAFILSNVPTDRLSRRQMEMVRTYVRDFGGGFIMLGGDESFGLGGYFGTPIEDILPVRMPIQKDMIRPSLAIMLVIDKSGSMAGVKIQLAKRAAIATGDAINPRDQIGVVGFDGQSRVLLELTSAADRSTVVSSIAALEAGGGTFLYPALEDAHERLLDSNARRKHVVVLSDGQTAGFGYEELVQIMAADGITLSAVGIGDGADMQLMESIALAGAGRAYFTDDFYTIPQIFTREALRASKSMLIERLVLPVAIGEDAALKEIDSEELPLLTGYVATTAKAAANVVVVSDSGDPLLAKWRCGLGRTAAFTSETKPRWAEDWLEWPDFAKFWSQLVRSITGEDLATTVSIECTHSMTDDGVVLAGDVRDSQGDFVTAGELTLSASDSNGRLRELPVERVGPGLFEARVAEIDYGADQQFVWQFSAPDATDQTASYGFVYSFSPEFRTLGVATDTLEDIATRAGGEFMRVGTASPVPTSARSLTAFQLWPILLVVSLVLVPFDIFCRRVG